MRISDWSSDVFSSDLVVHGVGLCGEYPAVVYLEDFDAAGYDGVFEAGMAVCVESYIGEEDGREGVKLEQQVLIAENGAEPLSTFPFEDLLLARSEEHTSELQSLMRISYAVFCLKKKNN